MRSNLASKFKRFDWSAAPEGATTLQKSNFRNVQIDGLGAGLASAAGRFLPIFLARLGATNFQVGLFTAMPAFTGLMLSLAVGRFLQGGKNAVPWYSRSRLLYFSCYALIGFLSAIVSPQITVLVVLAIYALATLPQTMVSVTFAVVMNGVAGADGRYALMSRRWSLFGLTTVVATLVAGQMLSRLGFPGNYQLVLVCFSLGGVICYVFAGRIVLPDSVRLPRTAGLSPPQRIKGYLGTMLSERPYVSFVSKRLVYVSGVAFAGPLIPLYLVRVVQASDAWIGAITAVPTAVMLLGYTFWTRTSRSRGPRRVLLWTTFALAVYPMLIASTQGEVAVVVIAGVAGLFQAGLDLVFFDEFMKTVPPEHSASFISMDQTLQYLTAVAMPLLATLAAKQVGLGGALLLSGGIRLVGVCLFALEGRHLKRKARAWVRKARWPSLRLK